MMKKRIISLLLAMMMLVGVMSVSAFAAEASTGTLSVAASAEEVKVGDTFDVTISVTAEEIAALQLGFVYDAECLELVKNENTYEAVLAEGIPGTAFTSATRSIWAAGLKTEDYSGLFPDELFTNLDGQFMTLTFKALKASDAASVTINAKGGTILEKYITFADASATVKITEATQPDEPEKTVVLGDADGNGYIDTNDATYILKWLAYSEPADFVIDVCDCDGSGFIDTNDATFILNYLAWLESGSVAESVVITGYNGDGSGIWELAS